MHDENSLIPASFKVSIDHLFDNLQYEKMNSCFGKKSEKSLEICMNSDQDNQKHDKCVILSEIVNFSNLFQHYVLLFSLISVAVFCQGCKCHDVAPDETCLDCLRSKCNIGS